MKLRLAMAMGLALAGSVAMLYAEHPMAAESGQAAMGMEKHPAMSQEVYACADCHVLSTKAGMCPKCQKEMGAKHLLGTKDGEALLCDCAAGCKCDAKSMKDGKCACGKEVKSMKATGLYACPMGCPMMSDAAGKCPGCGMELKKAE